MLHPRKFDKAVGSYVAKIPQSWNSFMHSISVVGGSVYATSVLLLTGMLVIAGSNRELLPLLLLGVCFSPFAEILKLITRRKRPETIYVEKMRLKTYSFPSGHAYVSALTGAHIMALSTFFFAGTLLWIPAVLVVVFTGLVGLSRMYLGAHFPSDVIAGWLLGLTMGWLLILLSM